MVQSSRRASMDLERVEGLRRWALPAGTKGLPLGASQITVEEIARSGWNVLKGDVPMPAMVLRRDRMDANILAMQQYCDAAGVQLCPHGKTTMAPQLFSRQIEAGAWGLTAATPSHLATYRAYGVSRVIYANQIVEPHLVRWLAAEMARDDDFELICLVDSVASVALLDAMARDAGMVRPLQVLIEIGHLGGRCGVRDAADITEVANAVTRAPLLSLRGVECFEGLVGTPETPEEVDPLLTVTRDAALRVLDRCDAASFATGRPVISAGGSAFFDRVTELFAGDHRIRDGFEVVLRSGCYITQDGGFYHDASPLDGRGPSAGVLQNALEVWGSVLSRPEPDLAIVGAGRRDVSHDMGLPSPIAARGFDGERRSIDGADVVALSDQHAHVRVPLASDLAPGDVVGFAVSHPCTTFDRWRLIYEIDEDAAVIGAIVTAF